MRLAAASLVAPTIGLAGATGAGWVMRALHVPLPWLIGPLLALAVMRIARVPAAAPPGSRQLGQAIIGLAVGLYFTTDVMRQVAGHAALMLAACLGTLLLSAVTSLLLARLGRVDLKTAYFSSMPGGAAEMSVLGDRLGANPGPIALAQSLRIAVIVLTVPPAVSAFVAPGSHSFVPALQHVVWPRLVPMLAVAVAVSGLAARARINNAWMLGALATGIAVAALGLPLSAVPRWLISVAQVLVGAALGARFDRDFLLSAPRFTVAAAFCSLLLVVICAGVGTLVAWGSGFPLDASMLATAPGSIGEMSVTARVLGTAVPIVTALQLMRILVVVLLAAPLFTLCQRLAPRLAPRPAE